MTNDRDHDLPTGVEERWKDWASSEPQIDEAQLRRNLRQRLPDRIPRPRTRLVLVAAAASLLAVMIGVESFRRPPTPVAGDQSVVHETGSNVILVVREGMEPIYIATERSKGGGGE
jgi:hypothetical protein